MEQLNKFEKTVAQWYKNVPHLPKGFTDWLAENVWWLVIIGVALSLFAIPALLGALLLAMGISASFGVYGAGVTEAGFFGVVWLAAILSLAGIVVTTILEIMAISPLKAKKKRGWTLLFAVALFNLAFAIVSNIVTFNLVGAVFAVIWAGVWGYFLFEIHSYFGAHHKVAAKTTEKAKA